MTAPVEDIEIMTGEAGPAEETAEAPIETLVDDVSIDGMCGVY
jgi:mycofactocin precursor